MVTFKNAPLRFICLGADVTESLPSGRQPGAPAWEAE